jgi:hypothetical protein
MRVETSVGKGEKKRETATLCTYSHTHGGLADLLEQRSSWSSILKTGKGTLEK